MSKTVTIGIVFVVVILVFLVYLILRVGGN